MSEVNYQEAVEKIKETLSDFEVEFELTETKSTQSGFSDLLAILINGKRMSAISVPVDREVFENYLQSLKEKN